MNMKGLPSPASSLLIVESPTKARTISKYLGKSYAVRAVMGHIKDLPQDSLGVDLESLKATYVWVKGKKKIMDEIKKLAQRAERVYIATDPDREGEAIAYFVKEELKKHAKYIHRIYFYEVTKDAILTALKNPQDINMNMVRAQFARRILDRLIGYILSPKLSKALGRRGLSVGRVQSPALRLMVEREEQIRNFKKKTYYYIRADFEKDGITFSALWDYRFEKPENAEPFLKKLSGSMFEVRKVERSLELLAPPKPFITASLQSSASKVLGVSVDTVQRIAQDLYERGYITYPRTDAHRMNEAIAKAFMSYIEETYGKEYVGKLRIFREKASSFSAHECIRPTQGQDPFKPLKELYSLHRDLYELIAKRTLASLSTPLKLEKTKVELTPLSFEDSVFTAHAQRVVFKGWALIYPHEIEQMHLPELSKGELLKPKRLYLHMVQTSPPERYTEGALVKKLETLGIGRPSTYASIVETLKSRGYVKLEKGFLKPLEIAFDVIDFLKENYPKVLDYNFTKLMEEELDKVEEGKLNYKEVISSLYRSAVEI